MVVLSGMNIVKSKDKNMSVSEIVGKLQTEKYVWFTDGKTKYAIDQASESWLLTAYVTDEHGSTTYLCQTRIYSWISVLDKMLVLVKLGFTPSW